MHPRIRNRYLKISIAKQTRIANVISDKLRDLKLLVTNNILLLDDLYQQNQNSDILRIRNRWIFIQKSLLNCDGHDGQNLLTLLALSKETSLTTGEFIQDFIRSDSGKVKSS